MGEFKFGDLVSHEEFGIGLVVRDESETQGYYVEVRFKDTGQTHPFSHQWQPDFSMHTNALTLISRHQESTKFDIAAQETWPEVGDVLFIERAYPDFYQCGYFRPTARFEIKGHDGHWVGVDATHWMPMPTPPKKL